MKHRQRGHKFIADVTQKHLLLFLEDPLCSEGVCAKGASAYG